jgi:Protein of unknown function (DUF3500)
MKRKVLLSVLLTTVLTASLFIACKKDDTNASTTTASISALTCSSTTFSGTAAMNVAFTGTASVPYTGGNGAAYAAGSAIASTGVTGLTATLSGGTLASGDGNLLYSITGTPASAGTATFAISLGGQSCTLELTVNASAPTSDCDTKTGAAKLACLCDAFKATLTAAQITTLQQAYTFANIKTWSNLPSQFAKRLGLKFGDLTETQLTAAKAIVKEMTGTVPNEGWDEVQQIWSADDYLNANGGGTFYGTGNYYIAFFGTPATTGTFEIMMTGHHKTVANTYTNGGLVAATPHFEGVEPTSFTVGSTTYVPISQEKDAFVAVLSSLSATELTAAKSGSTFSGVVLGPGVDWQFPTAHAGLQVGTLTTAQKNLVLDAIKTFVYDIDDTNAATFYALYSGEINDTYILYSGSNTMNVNNDYFRIDGPHVWIEFNVNTQNALATSGVHYHAVWRDRLSDYAGTH